MHFQRRLNQWRNNFGLGHQTKEIASAGTHATAIESRRVPVRNYLEVFLSTVYQSTLFFY